MIISNVIIKNYRNLADVNIKLSKMTTIIGNNNSGKSNLLKALTLPLISEELGFISKKLTWSDINNKKKEKYYDYIMSNTKEIVDGSLDRSEFQEKIPFVSVQLNFTIEDNEIHAVKDIGTNQEDQGMQYSIKYEYKCKNPNELLEHIKGVIKTKGDDFDGSKLERSLLPLELYDYSIFVPYKNQPLSYDILRNFKYNSIAAERDDFSSINSSLGSKPLVKILNRNLEKEDLVKIEEQYHYFFEEIKKLSNMEKILNWQDQNKIENAKDFFEKINIVPNMPGMNSLLTSVKLGYEDMELSLQGLGNRNLILQMVLLNSLLEVSESMFSLLTIEEPEAHLCYSNEQLLKSYLNVVKESPTNLQLMYTTHSTNFIDKVNLSEIVLMSGGKSFSFSESFGENELNYLSRNPNLDLYKLFYSRNVILVEGISEELLIRSHLSKINMLNDIEVITFHKGYTSIIELWKKINIDTVNRIGVVRDFDNQEEARRKHHELDDDHKVFVRTTVDYTLEDDVVRTEGNFEILKNYFIDKHGWPITLTIDQLIEKWKQSKADIMLQFCRDINDETLKDFQLPKHIKGILDVFVGDPVVPI